MKCKRKLKVDFNITSNKNEIHIFNTSFIENIEYNVLF